VIEVAQVASDSIHRRVFKYLALLAQQIGSNQSTAAAQADLMSILLPAACHLYHTKLVFSLTKLLNRVIN
jgi:hypothetical protein